jgi:LPS-assembly protein
MVRVLSLLCFCCAIAGSSVDAFAQDLGNCRAAKQMTIDRLGADHVKLLGRASDYGLPLPVEVTCGDDKFFADVVEVWSDVDRLVATGNVVFTSGTSRIAAERVEFNTKTRMGTFFQASGSAALQGGDEEEDRSHFGTQEPDVYFYGDTVEKVGPKKYRISKGGFTTCVQPQPRWHLTSSSVTVNLDEYAILRNSLFKVKGVPVLYLPLFYYPIQEDDRATGFLLPSYGTSTIRGQALSNAFFWAINRSQDATFTHDWFTKAGQGFGGEYRYVRGPGSDGLVRVYALRENGAEYGEGEEATVTPSRRSYSVQGNVSQRLGPRLRARGRADYFSDITVQQTYHQNIYQASQRRREFTGSLSGNWREYSFTGTVDRKEDFYGATGSRLNSGAPRIKFNRGERPLLGSPVYFGVTSEFYRRIVERKREDEVVDQSLTRLDASPLFRVPFTRWPFLTVNSSFKLRTTYWSESLDEDRIQISDGITRTYYQAETEVTGPVFNRIWTFAGNKYAEKLKHSIEPTFGVARTSPIENFDRIVRLDTDDNIVGSVTRVTYGVANRIYRKPPAGGRSREILNATLEQTYYSDAEASRYDRYYRTRASSNYSPLALSVRAWPTDRIVANFRAEYDTDFHAIREIAADGTVEWSDWLQATTGWSQRRLVEGLPGFDDPDQLDHYLNATTHIRLWRNRLGGTHNFNYDVLRTRFLQQRFMVYYNAQCCGFGVEYQHYDLSGVSLSPVGQDRRFNFSVTLAGIGSFGNFFGAMGGPTGP